MKIRTAFIVSLAASLALPAFVSAQNANASPEEQAALDAMIRARGNTPATQAAGPARGAGPGPAAPAPPMVMRGGARPPAMAPVGGPFAATLQSISESRSMNVNAPVGMAQNIQPLRLSFLLTGDDVNKAMSARKVTVTKALSNLDDDLVPTLMPQGPVVVFTSPLAAMMNSATIAARRGLTATATLRSTSRAATSIKIVEGEVDLFTPTETNGGKIVIPNIASLAGKPLEHPVLVKNGIEFYFINSQSQMPLTQQNLPSRGTAIGVVTSASQNAIDFNQAVVLSFTDPNGLVGGYELQDGNGTRIQVSGTPMSSGQFNATLQVRPQTKLPADAQLVIYVAVPEAIKTFPFKLENVPLP